MKVLSLTTLILALSFTACARNASKTGSDTPTSSSHSLNIDGTNRTYKVHVGSKATSNSALIIVLHGGGGNGSYAETKYEFNSLADQEGFIVAYPDGTGILINKDLKVWNAGTCCGIASSQQINDNKFILNLIDDMKSKYSVNASKIYLTGMSNGAMLAYKILCENPEKIKGVVAVAGTLAMETCSVASKAPVLHIHGDSDNNVPFTGGTGSDSVGGGTRIAVMDLMNQLKIGRGCAAMTTTNLPNGDIQYDYTCEMGGDLKVRLLKDVGHEWPGGKDATSGTSFKATLEAWNFLKALP